MHRDRDFGGQVGLNSPFIDGISIIILTMPIVYPLIITLGYDPIWFGVILVLFIEMCCITPLVGVNLYTIHGLAPERPLSDVIMGSLPFFILMIVAPVLLTAFPVIATWLPYSMAHFR